MSLADRHYMRDPEPGYRESGPWSMTTKLMVAVVVSFVAQVILQQVFGVDAITYYLALHAEGLGHGFVWQLLTFQFMHGGVMHLLGNLLAIYFFGRPIEHWMGGGRMLQMYLASGVVGGLFQIGMGFALPMYFGGAVVGASAGAFGLVAAFATLFPEKTITLLLFFVIPISMRAKTLLWISIGIAGLGILTREPGIAHAAHLGGICAGVIFIRYSLAERLPTQLTWRFQTRKKPVPAERVSRSQRPAWSAPAAPEKDLPSDEFISREVDPILDKISQHGIHSLTDREKRLLERARNRMAGK